MPAVNFTITAQHTSLGFTDYRQTLYYGQKKTLAAARKHAQTTLERLRKKHGGSFTDYRVEYEG